MLILKTREMLIQSGVQASQIEVKFVDASRRPAKDILLVAKQSKTGTIVLGRRGTSDVKDYPMESLTRKVLSEADDTAVWIVS